MRYLIEQAKQGDQSAFGQLYANTYNKNYYAVLKMFGNDVDAQAVLQEAYAKIYAMLGEFVYHSNEEFEAWTGTVVSNTALDIIRQHNPNAFTSQPEDMEYVHFSEGEMYAEINDAVPVSDQVAADKVYAVLAILTEEERTCVLMYYVHHLSVYDIAQSMGCPESMVGRILHYAKNQIIQMTEQNRGPELWDVMMPALSLFVSMLSRDLSGMLWSNAATQAYGTVYSFAVEGASRYMGMGILGAAGQGAAAAHGYVAAGASAAGGAPIGAAGVGAANAGGVAAGQGVVGHVSGVAAGQGVAAKVGISLGAKVAVGIATTALVVGGGLGIAHYADSKKENVTTEQLTEVQTTEAAIVSEEPTTEEQLPDTRYYQNYSDILHEHSYNISRYSTEMYGYLDNGEISSVAIADITGDDIPELIFVECEDGLVVGQLLIYTMDENGNAVEIYKDESYDLQVAGGTHYYMFQLQDDHTLYDYTSITDTTCSTDYRKYVVGADGKLSVEYLLGSFEDYDYYEDENDRPENTYTANGVSITEADFNQKVQELENNTEAILLNNSFGGWYTSYPLHPENIAMTYGAANRMLNVVETTSERPLPFERSQQFTFTSGVGGWGTTLTLNPDGTFSGVYSDWDAVGLDGEMTYTGGYESYSEFEGKFTNIQKVNDNVYSMTLESYTTKQEVGSQWVENETLYTGAEPYGIYGGKTFYLYLPGMSVSELPSEYVSWCYELQKYTILPYFGLYNVEEVEGFSGQ